MATRKRHTPEQVVRKFTQADRLLGEGKDVADVCRELQVSEQTYYRWLNQFAGLSLLSAPPGELLDELARILIVVLNWWALHEVCGWSEQRTADAAVQGDLAAAEGVDDHARRVG